MYAAVVREQIYVEYKMIDTIDSIVSEPYYLRGLRS